MKNHSASPVADQFLFSGNRHETVPRALLLDRRLTPVDRNAWQVIRLMLSSGGEVFPSYEQLRPYLTTTPCAEKASLETVARVLTVLRLTRWLSLAQRRRAENGSQLSNLYILHDEPLTAYEAIQIDPEYFSLVSKSIDHASKTIRLLAQIVLQEIIDDPALSGQILPTRIQVLLQRTQTDNLSTAHESEVSQSDRLRHENDPISATEVSLKSPQDKALRYPKSELSSSNNNINTTTYPVRFNKLSPTQRRGIDQMLAKLPHDVQYKVVNEWDRRCQLHPPKSPAAYLFGMLQKAFNGEFNALKSADKTRTLPSPSVPSQTSQQSAINRAKIHAELIQLKAQLKMAKNP